MSTTFSPASKGIKRVQATISNTAVYLKDISGLSTTLVNTAQSALIQVRSGEINLSHAPEAPTTSEGITITAGQSFTLVGPNVVRNTQLIRNGGTDATVDLILEG